MKSTAFLVSLSVMVAAVTAAAAVAAAAAAAACCSDDCDSSCKKVTEKPGHYFKLLFTELENISVAPWSYRKSSEAGRLPETIRFAVCSTCRVEKMVARSISMNISVFKRHRNQRDWCKCQYELAVGCTCVSNELAR